ncbi:23S rRNA (adenine(1618)-N(6))-methyltransferase RlmF [Pedobacter sp. Du54]|uniref:23S rRNA (adenine(1618)-N(6))-methyltransferase RlmF n=1 Tax=Pedobacter anseongensis TaxID=3133439 RepID=UPI003098412E
MSTLHPRNKHHDRYDFKRLVKSTPELAAFVSVNKYGDESIDFANPDAVKCLNKSLLAYFYTIKYWDIPEGYLCPPIPGRADYIHYSADLLASSNNDIIPKGNKIKVLDIGVGANCVYPIIGHQEYGWTFTGSEIDLIALQSATNIVNVNPSLTQAIEIKHQPNKHAIFKGIIHKEKRFDLSICNPPFHASAADALAGTQRKVRNLGNKNYVKPTLNFGGKAGELWTEGGESGFISKMIDESKVFSKQVLWFTSLVSKSENLPAVYAMLKRADTADVRTNSMVTGNKVSRIVAWTFLSVKEQEDWVKNW